MESIKKYIAEVIGTFVLVLLGCGTAMLVGCDATSGGGYILTALAFGLVIVGMAYCIGNISGCHINPAVSLGVLLTGGMTFTDFVGYVVSQCVGAIAGAGMLKAIFDLGNVTDLTGGYTIDDDKYNGIYNIYDVIKRNSRYSEDGDEDDDPLQAVLNAINITAEEKYKLIKIGYDSENGADYGSNE